MPKSKIVDTNILINFWCKEFEEFENNIGVSNVDYEQSILNKDKSYILTPDVYAEFISKIAYYYFTSTETWRDILNREEEDYAKFRWHRRFKASEELIKFASKFGKLLDSIIELHKWSEEDYEEKISPFDGKLFIKNPAPVDYLLSKRDHGKVISEDKFFK